MCAHLYFLEISLLRFSQQKITLTAFEYEKNIKGETKFSDFMYAFLIYLACFIRRYLKVFHPTLFFSYLYVIFRFSLPYHFSALLSNSSHVHITRSIISCCLRLLNSAVCEMQRFPIFIFRAIELWLFPFCEYKMRICCALQDFMKCGYLKF